MSTCFRASFNVHTPRYTLNLLALSPQFGWTHVTLLIVVTQSHLIIHNLFEGMIWYVNPLKSNYAEIQFFSSDNLLMFICIDYHFFKFP